MIAFLGPRAIPGVEVVERDRYRRTLELDGRQGTIEVEPVADHSELQAAIHFPNPRALPTIVARIRRVFDLDADVALIDRQLSVDPAMARLVAARPGLRLPGAWDGFELGVRAILGQQVTLAAARQLAGKLVASYGAPLVDDGGSGIAGLSRVFPRPEVLAGAEIARLGMPRARAASISRLAAELSVDPTLFARGQDLSAAVARLRSLPGIGEWTAQYIAMRALREPDAFPASDVGLLRAVTVPGEARPSPADLLARADAWRPWRAYAAQHLWTSLSDPTTR
jgi:AraC family transcriptional regulator of adaptative response / DNA-3-methyladenine glycosylase II